MSDGTSGPSANPPELDDEVTQREGSRYRRLAFLLLRIAVAAAAIRLAIGSDPSDAFEALTDAQTGWVGLALLAMIGVAVLSALRWRSYLHAIGRIDVSFVSALRLTMIGGFFNAFLPTGVGGDAYKAMKVAPRGERSESLASVLLDRFSGLVGLSVVGVVAIAIDMQATPRQLIFVSEAIAVAIITATVVPRASREWILRRAHITDRGRIGHAIWRAVNAVAAANRSLIVASKGYGWGILTQAMLLLVHVSLARALGLDLGVGVLAGAAVVAQVAALIPLTINGLGFRESAYVWALGTAELDQEIGAAFALGILGTLLVVSAIGGLVYLISPHRSVADPEVLGHPVDAEPGARSTEGDGGPGEATPQRS